LNKTRWLSALLIASWILNVAFLVAYFSKNTLPCGAFISDKPPDARERGPFPGMPPHLREKFHQDVEPLHEEYQKLILELSAEMTTDTLDTVRLASLSDSLQDVRGRLQIKLMDHLKQLHRELPPEGRQHLARRLQRMMEDPMHGPGRMSHRGDHSRLQPDSIKQQ
jgi:hypothetical protein